MKYFQTHSELKSWILFSLICTTLIRSSFAIKFKKSPCPAKFAYEPVRDSYDDRWYGDISLPINATIEGSTIRIGLDRPSQLIVTTAGPITSNDNQVYIITHEDIVLEKGSTYKLIFMVKYDKNYEVPMLETIHFNGRRICPPDLVSLSIGGGNDYSSSRPDIKATEPTDVISDIDKRPNTPTRTTTRATFTGNNEGNFNFNSESPTTNRFTTSRTTNLNNFNNGGSNFNNFGNNNGEDENQGSNTYNPSNSNNFGTGSSNFGSGSSNNFGRPTGTSNLGTNSNSNQGSNTFNSGSSNNFGNTGSNFGSNLNQGNNGFNSGSSNNFGSPSNNFAASSNQGGNGFNTGTSNTFGSNTNNFGGSGSAQGNSIKNPNQGSNSFNSGSSNNFGSNSNQFGGSSGLNTLSGNNGNKFNEGSTSSQVKCGTVSIANPLITLAQNTEYGQWPWHAALFMKDEVSPSKSSYICGGSLVSKNKVITAAHCVSLSGNRIVNPDSLTVYLGKYNIHTDESTSQRREVIDLKVNPKYNKANFHDDIAILFLASDVEYTNYVRPICLWEATESIEDVVGKEGVVVGWGYNEHSQLNEELKMAPMPIVSADKCARSDAAFFAEYVSENAFCAGYKNGTGPCKGDSGGGLVIKRNEVWYLRGIVSVSAAPKNGSVCNTYHYIVFTDVAKYTDFIRRNLR